MNGKHFIGAKAQTANNVYTYPPVSKVILIVDDENVYMAGTDEGTVIEKECPYATQAMADNLLAMLQGYQYQSIEADAARIAPTAELGDGITVNGIYTQLAYKNIRFSTGAVVDVAAPGSVEAEHEYQQAGSTASDTSWKLAQTYSRISKTANEILLEVGSNMDDLSASIDIKIDEITSTVQGQAGQISQISQTVDSISSTVQGQSGQISSINQTLTNINSTISDLDGDISEIDQKVDSITLSVSNGSTSSTITLTVDGVQVSSQNISMSGLVTYTGLTSGTTTINGACIKTGTIDADRLNLTGAISFSDLSSSVQNDITSASNDASDAISAVNDITITERGQTYIDGSMIYTDSIYANAIHLGGDLTVYRTLSSNTSGGYLGYTSSAQDGSAGIHLQSGSGEVVATSNGAKLLYGSDSRQIYIAANNAGVDINGTGYRFSSAVFNTDNGATLGNSYYPWGQIYSTNSSISTSDEHLKHDIEPLPAKYVAMLDALEPKRFKFNNGTSNRYHPGFIAQDVKVAMDVAGIDSTEFGGWCKDVDADGNEIQMLRYEEFISPMLAKIKQLEGRISMLEANA